MQKRLEADAANNFHLVNTQGILTRAEWANELHPVPEGFQKVAQKFADALAARFPTRSG